MNLNKKVLALSWKEPFASLMLYGKIETRRWKTNYRGLVLICASKIPYKNWELIEISGRDGIEKIIKLKNLPDKYATGKAIAIGTLVDCRPMTLEDEDKCFVKYYPGLYCHVYEDIKAIEPINWKGTQGWKEVPEDFKNQIKFIEGIYTQ